MSKKEKRGGAVYPQRVEIREVGPREGLQGVRGLRSSASKAALINSLASTGIRYIQAVSFPNPDKVPQMQDAEVVVSHLEKTDGVEFEPAYYNIRGLERSLSCEALTPVAAIGVACSDTYSIKNFGQQAEPYLKNVASKTLERLSKLPSSRFYLTVMTAFGCNYEGPVSVDRCLTIVGMALESVAAQGMSVTHLMLGDTMGWATPANVPALVAALRQEWPDTRVGLHLHDSRGLGIASAKAGLDAGVDFFDTAIGGFGGSPFADHPGGNIATEEFVYLCSTLGVETGIDLNQLLRCIPAAQALAGQPLRSIFHLAPPPFAYVEDAWAREQAALDYVERP